MNHDKWLRKNNLHPDQLKKRKKALDANSWRSEYAESLRVDRSNYVSGGMEGSSDSCAVRGVMANLHKETPEVQKAILDKAKRTAPAFSKGGYQYITDASDIADLGKKR